MADAIGGVGRYRETSSPTLPSSDVPSANASSGVAVGAEALSRAAVGSASLVTDANVAPAGTASQLGATAGQASLATGAAEQSKVATSPPTANAAAQAQAEPAAAGAARAASPASNAVSGTDKFVTARGAGQVTGGGGGGGGIGVAASAIASGGSLAAGGAHASGLSATAAADVATITGATQLGSSATVHVESLGNPGAMTKELLQALAANAPGAASGEHLAVQAALLGLTQKAVDNIPRLLIDNDAGRGTKLYQVAAQSAPQAARVAELNFLASQSTRVQAAQALVGGPDWPMMLLEGLRSAASSFAPGGGAQAGADAFIHATAALYGRESATLTSHSEAADIFRTASLANAPLSLPAIGQLDVGGGELQTFVVTGTQLGASGEQTVTLLDVAASLEQGSEVHKSVELSKFAQALNVLVVPNGRPALTTERRQEDALHTLGLVGCCLTSGGGTVRAGSQPIRTSAPRGGGGLLENRCLTCARAQQLCQPSAAPPVASPPGAAGQQAKRGPTSQPR